MTLSITNQKADLEKMIHLCKDFLKCKTNTIRDLSAIIGNLVASFPAVTHGKLFYRQLENEKIEALKEAKGRRQFDAGVDLSDLAIKDLHWWLRNILGSKAPITRGQG